MGKLPRVLRAYCESTFDTWRTKHEQKQNETSKLGLPLPPKSMDSGMAALTRGEVKQAFDDFGRASDYIKLMLQQHDPFWLLSMFGWILVLFAIPNAETFGLDVWHCPWPTAPNSCGGRLIDKVSPNTPVLHCRMWAAQHNRD